MVEVYEGAPVAVSLAGGSYARAELNEVGLKIQHIRAARGQGWIINSVAPLREGGMVWYGMVEVCEYAPVAVSGWVLAVW